MGSKPHGRRRKDDDGRNHLIRLQNGQERECNDLPQVTCFPSQNSHFSKSASSNGTYPWRSLIGEKRPILRGNRLIKVSVLWVKTLSLKKYKVLVKKVGLRFSHKKRVFLRCQREVCCCDMWPTFKVRFPFRDVGRKKIHETKRKKTITSGRGTYIGNRVSKFDSKVKKGSFCEENHIKKVVQFQNGIFPK